MTEAKLNKHELRTRETREKLLRAAEQIFVRDGYAGADMAEVASLAGRTTGAIYAHFKSKEEIFIALFEESLERKAKAVLAVMASEKTKEEKRRMWRELYLEISKDRVWALLLLEYKLFSIRHPDAQNRLRANMHEAFAPAPDSPIKEMLSDIGCNGITQDSIFAVRMLQPIISALVVESQIDPENFDDETVSRYLLRVFDSVIC